MSEIKKTMVPGVYETGAGILVNVDQNALAQRKKIRKKSKTMEDRVKTLETELQIIKALLLATTKYQV